MRVVVTGASRHGIGGAICRRVASDATTRGEQAVVTMCSTAPKPDGAEFEAELRGMGAEVLSLYGDLSDPAVPAALVEQAVAFGDGLDGLVSNAGLARPAPLVETSVAEWDLLFAVHARAAWLLAKAAHDALAASRGAIVATGSITGTFPHQGHAAYAPAKAALITLCQTLALEWGGDGIRVNVVSPGPIETPISTRLYEERPELRTRREGFIPVHRLGRPDDVAAIVVFLLGPDAGFITGENVLVDGGLARSSLDRMIVDRADLIGEL